MLEHIKIFSFRESTIDEYIQGLGGTRLKASASEKERTSDYLFNEATIELKLINEEGLQKKTRQKAIAKLFRKNQPNRPVIIIHPDLLDKDEKHDYYHITQGPIQSAVQKANKQLKETSERLGIKTKVLLLINNGYQALSAKEFEEIAFKRVTNDTSHIDHLIVTGIYFYGDTFDHYARTEFKLHSFNVAAPFPSFTPLEEGWYSLVEKLTTQMITEPDKMELNKLPVVDISFEDDGNTFVKPPPQIGEESEFYIHGRPRINTSGIKECPPVGTILPFLSLNDWSILKRRKSIPNLQNTYQEYITYLNTIEETEGLPDRPIVKMPIQLNDETLSSIQSFHKLCSIATEEFTEKVRAIANQAYDLKIRRVEPLTYILLMQTEIGQDENNDMASLYFVNSSLRQKPKLIINDRRIFFNHALTLASSYAIKFNTDHVVFAKDTTYGWA